MNQNDLFFVFYNTYTSSDILSELPSKCQQNQMEIAVDKTKSNEDFQNDILEEEKEDTVKPIGKKKKKRKQGM